jgi:FtsP/CotA-like multicopper oxidase with cupredoxin domain
VRFRNELPADHVGFGIPSVITHLHNGHTASESDGFPLDFYGVGQHRDHHYANILAGYDAFPPNGDEREALGTLFYHDHRLDFTAPNVYKGLLGFYLLFDERDSGDETDPNPRAFRLPSGEFDVPLVFNDRRFTADGELFFDQFDTNGFLGDKFAVNGKIEPFLRVARRKYRFRLLNGGPSRFYELFLSNGQRFTQIASDGNLLPTPLERTSIRLGVAERADVVVDFSNAQLGEQIFLQNRLRQTSGRGPVTPVQLDQPGTSVLRFDVDRDADDPSGLPDRLRDLPFADAGEAVVTRTWSFNRANGAWSVNGRLFNVDRLDARVKRDTAEVWVLQTGGGNWSHPVHIHFEEFQILGRNGGPPPSDEIARKDIVRLAPRENARVFLRFRDFEGRYVMHCHNLLHEDHAMMIWFEIER